MISVKGKWLYLDICKTATTSIGKALRGKFPDARGRHHSWPNAAGDRYYCSPITDEQVRDFFTFALVRDPYSRAISNYCWHVKARRISHELPVLEFLRDLEAGRLTDFDDHIRIRPQSKWLATEPDYLGRFEDIGRAWGDICEALGIRGTSLPITNQSPGQKPKLCPEAKRIVARHYAEDFERFGYDP